MRAFLAAMVAAGSLFLSGCMTSDSAQPTALADGSVGYAVRAHLQLWDTGGVSDEEIVRRWIDSGYAGPACPEKYTVISMRRVPDTWESRPLIDAVIRCDK